ncbi:DUF5133 domain-containing protein [Streptomyces sp. NPDC088387]|uniref:DUF5133 domain-containing protein n=1 Tax=Streptomyces sp. NPDC088387 TaxID=3365859 RepID=UPI003825C6A5
MITPSATAVRTLLARYADARIAHESGPTAATVRRLDDVSYTLCVLTARTEIAEALAAADALLRVAEPAARVGRVERVEHGDRAGRVERALPA